MSRLEEIKVIIARVRCTELFDALMQEDLLLNIALLDIRINDHVRGQNSKRPLLELEMPGARHLGLNDIHVGYWNSFTDLTYLRLEYMGGSEGAAESFAMIARSPRLRVLQLCHVHDILEEEIDADQYQIHLPKTNGR